MDMDHEATSKQARPAPRLTRDVMVAACCGLVVALMVGASGFAPPLLSGILARAMGQVTLLEDGHTDLGLG